VSDLSLLSTAGMEQLNEQLTLVLTVVNRSCDDNSTVLCVLLVESNSKVPTTCDVYINCCIAWLSRNSLLLLPYH